MPSRDASSWEWWITPRYFSEKTKLDVPWSGVLGDRRLLWQHYLGCPPQLVGNALHFVASMLGSGKDPPSPSEMLSITTKVQCCTAPRCFHTALPFHITSEQIGRRCVCCLSFFIVFPVDALVSVFTIGQNILFSVALDIARFLWNLGHELLYFFYVSIWKELANEENPLCLLQNTRASCIQQGFAASCTVCSLPPLLWSAKHVHNQCSFPG